MADHPRPVWVKQGSLYRHRVKWHRISTDDGGEVHTKCYRDFYEGERLKRRSTRPAADEICRACKATELLNPQY